MSGPSPGSSLTVLTEVPAGLWDLEAAALLDVLGGPALLRVQGEREPALFLSVLLHGNETSGWNAVRRLLSDIDVPQRSLLLFVGNLEAAAAGERALPDQPDFNRVWQAVGSPKQALVDAVLREVAKQPLFAAIDLHNNTGQNPHYSVLTSFDDRARELAAMFSDKAVYVEEPNTVLSRAMEAYCPAIALEVGPVADPRSDERTFEALKRYLALESLPSGVSGSLVVHRSLGRLHVRDGVSFGFADEPESSERDLELTGGLESINFHAVEPGLVFGQTDRPLEQVLSVLNPQHEDVTSHFFEHRDGLIVLRRTVVPAMVTTDITVIRQDCLCYLMEPV